MESIFYIYHFLNEMSDLNRRSLNYIDYKLDIIIIIIIYHYLHSH